jgi:hypothetical protein
MEIKNIVLQPRDQFTTEAFISSPEKKLILETLLNTHGITFAPDGFGKLIAETEDYCGFITVEKIKINTSIEEISKLLAS